MKPAYPITPSLDPVRIEIRERHERLVMKQTGLKVQWIPTGVACEKCDGEGERIVYGEWKVGARTIRAHVPCGHCWRPSGLAKDEPSSGAAPCSICEDLPATIRFFDVDGDTWDICNGPGQPCFEKLKELVALEPAPADVVDSRAVR